MSLRKFAPSKSVSRARRRHLLAVLSVLFLLGLAVLIRAGAAANAFGILGKVGCDKVGNEYEKKYDCENPERLGDKYGGWVICRPKKSLKGGIVYTIGVGRNIEWDKEMVRKHGTVHYGWDPTPTALDFANKTDLSSWMKFEPIGLGVDDGELTLKLPDGNHDSYAVMGARNRAQEGTIVNVPVMTVESMLRKMGHKRLAILKMDVEGAEFEVIRKWARMGYRVPADQLLVEFHERYFGKKELLDEMVGLLECLGFKMVVRTTLECTFVNRRLKGGVLRWFGF